MKTTTTFLIGLVLLTGSTFTNLESATTDTKSEKLISTTSSRLIPPTTNGLNPKKEVVTKGAISVAYAAPCNNSADELGGNVFNDFNNDGIDAGDSEVGQENVRVEVYDVDGGLICTTLTDLEGNWNCAVDAADYPVRVEFSTPLQPYLQPSFAGGDNGTNTQFVTAPSCEVDYGVVDPTTFCQEDPDIVVTCFVVGDPTSAVGPFDVVVNYPQSREGVDVNDANYPAPNTLTTKSEAGTVWGMAYDRLTRDVFVSAFLKRHNGLLENDPTSGAPLNNPLGAIYRTNLGGGPAELLIDLSTVGVDVGTVPSNADRGVDQPPNRPTTDALAYTLIGKVGLGDIALDEDNDILYAINLFEKTLISIEINDDGTAGAVSSTPIPDPGCTGGEMRPFAIEIHQGEVFLGVVCDGSVSADRADLSATVYRGDGASFLPIVEFPLNYPKGFSIGSCAAESEWQGWRDAFPDAPCSIGGNNNNLFFYSFSQPMLTNIDFDTDGAIVLSFTDRFSHQMGYNNADLIDPPEGGNFIAAVTGDLLRVARLADGTYELENNATAGNLTAIPGVDNGEGPGGGEFYFGDFAPSPNNPNRIAHSETGQGAAAINAVTGVMTATMIRPGNNTLPASAGTTNMVAMEGTVLSGYSLFEGFNTSGVYGKGGGLGDLMLACNPLPIQIGNYVWVDADKDGVQDANEQPIPNLPVSLYNNVTMEFVAVDTTDENGNYFFNNVDRDTDYAIVFGYDANDMNSPWNAGSMALDLDETLYTLTDANEGEGGAPDLNDSDATLMDIAGLSGYPIITYTTADTTDHTLDVGFVQQPGLSLGSTVFLDNNNDGFQNGADTGIAMVEVQLWDATTMMQILTDANGIPVTDPTAAGTVLTDAMGNYLFSELREGDYFVVLPLAPASAPLSSNNTGIAFNETDPDDDLDNDDEGLQAGGTGMSVRSATITLSLGEEPENGTTDGTETAQGNMQDDADDANGNMTLDFGFFAPVSIEGAAFVDLDGNGLRSPDEPGLGGVTVAMLDSNGDTVLVDADGNMIPGVVMTGPDGSYRFGNLPPGTYSARFDIGSADNAEFYVFTVPDAGDDTQDSDNSNFLSDSTAQSNPRPFLNSGGEDLTLAVGVICNVSVTVAEPFTICSTQPILLTEGASIIPAPLGGNWSTPDGTGAFTTGMDFTAATTYLPSAEDAKRGSVTLILTTNDPDGPCEPVTSMVTVQILKVDCGSFFWDGRE